ARAVAKRSELVPACRARLAQACREQGKRVLLVLAERAPRARAAGRAAAPGRTAAPMRETPYMAAAWGCSAAADAASRAIRVRSRTAGSRHYRMDFPARSHTMA